MTKIKKNTTGKPTTATPLSPMMTVAEVAELLGFGQNFVYRLVSKPGFPQRSAAIAIGSSAKGRWNGLRRRKSITPREVLHNMRDPEVDPLPGRGELRIRL